MTEKSNKEEAEAIFVKGLWLLWFAIKYYLIFQIALGVLVFGLIMLLKMIG